MKSVDDISVGGLMRNICFFVEVIAATTFKHVS